MDVIARPEHRGPRQSRPGRSQGALQARGTAHKGWPPRFLTPVPRGPSRGLEAAEFIEGLCLIVKDSIGGPVGAPIVLRPWQRKLIDGLLAVDPVTGRFRHRQALIGIGRKNGKSAMIASLALWALYMGPDGGEIYSVAGDREQARIVFGTGKRMVEMQPELAGEAKTYRDAIEHKPSGSVWRVVSSDAPLKEGLSPTFTVVDEVHVIPKELWNVFALAMGARPEPMMVGITTAGVRVDGTGSDSLCYGLYQYGRRVAAGELVDPSFYFAWWEAAAALSHRDPRAWRQANPGYGELLDPSDMRSAVLRTAENEFRTKRLNQWVAVETAWLPEGTWRACEAQQLDLDPAVPLYVGIDVSLRNDATAVVASQRQDGRIVVRAKVWENPYPLSDGRYENWRVDHGDVEKHLRELRERFPVSATEVDGDRRPGPGFFYDPAFFSDAARRLDGDGLAMVEFPQTDARMVPACQGLYELITTKVLAHDGDTSLARHLANASAKETGRGWRLTKPRGSRRKIDAAIALAISTYGVQTAAATPADTGPPRYFTFD